MLDVTLIGYGAIGRSLHQRLQGHAGVRIAHVVVSQASLQRVRDAVGPDVGVSIAVPMGSALVLECAGHGALTGHVLPALARGVECAVLSVGALSVPGLVEQLDAAAQPGRCAIASVVGRHRWCRRDRRCPAGRTGHRDLHRPQAAPELARHTGRSAV